MISIREVAKLAGVSPATVSRVMNGTANVDPKKKEKVLKVIEETNFVPNEVARSLYRKSANLIGVVLPSLQNPYFTQLAGSIEEAAGRSGYRMLLCDVGNDSEKVKSTLQMFVSMNVDGVVLASGGEDVEQYLQQYPIPVVSVDCMEHADHVRASLYCDYYRGGRLAMEHLIACGCQNIVCIRSDQTIFSARMRYLGYRDVCAEHGIAEQTVDCDYDFRAGLEMTEVLLHQYPQVDGIMACNDMVAVSTFKILHKKNIRVPEQIQLVGFDDIHLTRLISPELTTIHQPIEEMAEKAISLLTEPTPEETEEGEHTMVFPVSLVIRETTGRKDEM